MKSWMDDSSDDGSFQWLSELHQGFQVSNCDSSAVILQYIYISCYKSPYKCRLRFRFGLCFFFKFIYPGANVVQLRFLRLHSSTATQSLTYSCHPGHRLGLADTEVKFLTDTKKQSYLGILKDCVVRFLPPRYTFVGIKMKSTAYVMNSTKCPTLCLCVSAWRGERFGSSPVRV